VWKLLEGKGEHPAEETSIDEFFNVMATETLALFEHLEFDFLEIRCVRPRSPGANTRSSPPALFRAFLHCYYKNVYGIRPVTRELQNTVVWLSCGFDRPPSRRGRSLPHRPRTRRRRVFDRLVEQAACRGLLDSTDLHRFHRREDDARRPRRVEGYDPTAEEYYHGYGCTIVSTGQKIPIAAEFTESKQAPEETAMRVTCDALAVENRSGCLETAPTTRSAGTTTCWPQGSCQSPYNARNTDDPKDIEYRVEARIDEHSEDVQLKQSTLDETYNRRVESNRPTTPSGLRPRARSRPGRVHEHKCSSRCAFVLLRSPTTNAETIQEAPSSRYENYSMTPSNIVYRCTAKVYTAY